MRQIKFRAWNQLSDGGEMVTEENSGLKSWQILERFSVVMQYTGLKDRNKTDIYEGDILLFPNKSTGIVVWEDACFAIKSTHDAAIDYEPSSVFEAAEIIGNTYELLT